MSTLRTVGTFVLMMTTALPIAAQTITTTRDDASSTSGARGIVTADLNRDGWLDIATANHSPDGVSVLINRGAAGGYTATFIPIAGGPFDIAAGDLNRDGIPDLAVANADAYEINVLFGLPTGGFRAPLHIGASFNPRGIAIGDIDKDGKPDIVYTQWENRGVQILYGDGAGNFTMRAGASTVGVNPQGVAIADFNMDGWPDLVVASAGSVGLTILYQTPGGVGTFSPTALNVPTQQNVVAVGDFNRDGRPDVAAASTATSDVTIFVNGSNFTEVLVYPSGGGSPRGIAIADLNRDGAPDVVTGNRSSSSVEILPGHGDGTFGTAYGFAAGSGSRTVALGDFNRDGRIDIASANEYAASATVLSNTTTFPKAAYAFSRTVMGSGGNGYSGSNSSDVADFDLDGKFDVVTDGSNGGAVVLFGKGTSTSLPTLIYGPRAIHAVNLNADAYPDVVLLDSSDASQQRSVIESYIGAGNGQFPGRKATPTPVQASLMTVADFDRDGRIDVAVFGYNPDSSENEIWIFAGNGDGSFVSRAMIGRGSNGLVVGDVNRDGLPDVTAYWNSGNPGGSTTLYTWINEGRGAFTDAPRAIVVTGWDGLYGGDLGDVNEDGWPDLVASGNPTDRDYAHKSIGVLAGGPYGFAAPTYVACKDLYVFPPHLADINVDGHLDILTEQGSIIAGRGDGTFAAPAAFDYSVPGLHVLDFNKDGLPDVVGHDAAGAAQIILNQHRDNNLAPTVALGPDYTIQYRYQFGDGELEFWAQGADPDLHKLTFKWFDGQGTLVADTGVYPYWTPPTSAPGSYTYTVEASDGRGAVARDSMVFTVLPEKEVVVYAGQGYNWITGDKWSIVNDASAAGGVAVHDRNDSAPKVTSPLAAPASYIDVEFVADPTQTYKLWVRLKAEGNAPSNDSVWLQFSGAVDANGRTFAPGSTSGIEVVLEECSGCGDAGWGWRDEAWGQRDAIGTVTLRFPNGGAQHVRFQTREDGVYVDQVVLSAEKYLTTRPGTVKNDTTILPGTPY